MPTCIRFPVVTTTPRLDATLWPFGLGVGLFASTRTSKLGGGTRNASARRPLAPGFVRTQCPPHANHMVETMSHTVRRIEGTRNQLRRLATPARHA